jgi:hypothetical protein
MDEITPEISRFLAAKETRRRLLAALPYPEKVSIVRRLQAMAAPLWQARGRPARVWQADTPPPRR